MATYGKKYRLQKNSLQKSLNKQEQNQSLGKGASDFQSRPIILVNSSTFQKKYDKKHKETGKYSIYRGKKQSKKKIFEEARY